MSKACSRALSRALCAAMALALALSCTHARAAWAAPPNAEGASLVTIIVQLDAPAAGMSAQSESAESRHRDVKDALRGLVRDAASMGAQSAGDPIIELYDYYHAIDGFAVKAPASVLGDLKALPGVKNAFAERSYEVPADIESGREEPVRNLDALAMTGADSVEERGDGCVIAVIDSALDVGHEAFSGDLDDELVAWTSEEAARRRATLTQGGRDAAYVSEKIPFAYDYADGDSDVNATNASLSHGTHVAGIAVANAGQIRGSAPNAQLAFFKVADDFSGKIYESVLLAAIDDAVVLSPDVLSMSLGSDAGFGDPAASTYADALESLRQSGCNVVVSAGNSYSQGYRGPFDGGLPSADAPDYGLVSSPATLPAALAVASADRASGGYLYFTAADGRKVGYVMGERSEGASGADFTSLPEGRYAYVDAGIGSDADKERVRAEQGGDLKGAVAIVRDGSVDGDGKVFTTIARLNGAAALGPAAIILVDAGDGELLGPSVQNMSADIPVVRVSASDGEALLAAEDKTITVSFDGILPLSRDFSLSDFSSWGVTPELGLKPEVTAPGGDIYSSILKGGYGWKSGTSMAAPHIAGISALLQEHLAGDSRYSRLDGTERAAMAMRLLMCTAAPVCEDGAFISPRKQGAGMANVPAAVGTDVYLTVEGASDSSRPKAELGSSDAGSWEFTITLHNVGDVERAFTPSVSVLCEDVADGAFQLRGSDVAGTAVSVELGGDAYDGGRGVICVGAGAEASLTVGLSCTGAFAEIAASAPNGTFVDGFARLLSADGGVDLSVPFLGFYGDWGALPAFDSALASGEGASLFATRLLNADRADELVPLGVNPLDEQACIAAGKGDFSQVDPSKAVVSGSTEPGAPNAALPATGLLRNARTLTYSYVGQDGDELVGYSYDYLEKSVYDFSEKRASYPEEYLDVKPVFNGTSADGREIADQAVTLHISATPAGVGAAVQSQVLGFQYDSTPPEVTAVASAGGLAVSVADNTFVAGIEFADPAGGEAFLTKLADGELSFNASVTRDELEAAWREAGLEGSLPDDLASLRIVAYDYGMNAAEAGAPASTEGDFVIEDGVLVSYRGADAHVEVPRGVTAIGPRAFEDSPVRSVVVPSTVAAIGERAFAGLADLRQVVFVDDDEDQSMLVSVGERAFADSGVLAITFPRNVAELGPGVLEGASVRQVSIGPKVKSVPERAFADSDLITASLAEGVTFIGKESFAGCSRLESVSTPASDALPASLRSIGERAFADAGIGAVSLPEGLEGIGSGAFSSTGISELAIPDSVTDVGPGAFSGMASLSRVAVGRGLDAPALEGAFEGDRALVELRTSGADGPCVSVNGVLYSADGAVLVAYPLGVYGPFEVPEGVERIAGKAFAGAATTSVAFPDSLREIGDGAFADSDLAGELALPEGLSDVGAEAFARTPLSAVDIGGAVSLGDSSFAGCPNLTSADFRQDLGRLERIGASAFNPASPLTSVALPDSVVSVGLSAFTNNSALESVHIGAGVSARFDEMFARCDNVSAVSVSDASPYYLADNNVLYSKEEDGLHLLKSLPSNSFAEYTVVAGTVAIEPKAFDSSKSLVSIVLPEGLESIGAGAFNGCSSLSAVSFPDSLRTVNGFYNTSIDVASFGSAVVEIHRNAFTGHNPAHIVVRGGVDGSYSVSSENGSDRQPVKTAYFGEGMTSLNFGAASRVAPPELLVVPSTTTSVKMNAPSGSLSYDASAIVVYAPRESSGWAAAREALLSIGADPDTQLLPYTALSVECRAASEPVSGAEVAVSAEAAGGVAGAKEYRFVQTDAGGPQTVVRDWDGEASALWQVPEGGASIRAEARDATLFVAVSAELASASPAVPTEGTEWKRLWGETALDTMAAIVEEGFESSDAVVVATSEGYWDALAASALAGAEGAPVLLTAPDSLSEQAAAQIRRLGATRAYVCGGEAAVSAAAAAQIEAMGVSVTRLGGADAPATAALVSERAAELLGPGRTCVVATPAGFYDSLSAAPGAYALGMPVYLTGWDGSLSDGTLGAIRAAGYGAAVLAGGPAAVSPAVVSQLESAGIPAGSVERLGGADAWETSLLVAEWELARGMSADRMGVADGNGYWDALTGAALCGKSNSALVLVPHDGATADGSYFSYNPRCIDGFVAPHAAEAATGYVFGGDAAVPAATMEALKAATR